MRIALTVILLLLVPVGVYAATIHVPTDAPTIQAGIDAADSGDTVLVACGTYFEHDIVLRSGLHLRSETGTPDCVTIDAQQQGRVLFGEFVDQTSSIVGLTIQNGDAGDSESGGGILLRDSFPLISACVVLGNRAGSGGALYCDGSSPVIQDCLITMNSAGGTGGGIRCSYGSDVEFTRCVISSNHAMDAGGMWVTSGSSPILSHCTFIDNVGDFWGGAIGCQGATPILRNYTLVDNEAGWTGGGIWCSYESVAHLENTIVAFSREGGGIHCYIDSNHPSNALLTCCDVFGNAEGEYGGSLEDQTGLNGNISEDPRFCDSALRDFGLYSDSPCRPEGNDCGVLIGAHGVGCYIPAEVETEVAERRRKCLASPNPSRLGTSVQFDLQEGSHVTMTIHNLSGRRVRTVGVGGPGSAVPGRLVWDGRDDLGTRLPQGVYLYRLDTDGRVLTGKVTVVE